MDAKAAVNAVVEKLLDLCRKNPQGISQEAITSNLRNVSLNLQAKAINELLSQHKLYVYKSSQGLIYKHVTSEQAIKFKGLSSEELLCYQLIQSTQNMGIWTRDLKIRSNLQQPQIVKILKLLEGRKLIKAVKSVANKNRKVYMVAELEPSKEITGGAWYTENEFDHEFIEVLRNACYQFVIKKQEASIKDICAFISQKGLSNIELKEDDIHSIVDILVYDGMLDEKAQGEGRKTYIPAVMAKPPSTALSDIPCGKCPVFQECRVDGILNPRNCTYLEQWLEDV